jgi:hypothetical protein
MVALPGGAGQERRWRMAAKRKAHANGEAEQAGYRIQKYGKSRFWAVIDAAEELVCITVYKRGALEVVRRLAA